MKLVSKSLIILGLGFALRIIQSCGCPDNPLFFNFDQIAVINLDNSTDYPRSSPTNTMYSSAVAFEIRISDSNGLVYLKKGNSGFGFSEAIANDCPMQFKSNQQISKITIITMEALSSEIPENTDVTELFLGLAPYSSSFRYLYEPIDNLYTKLNQETYFDDTTVALQIFCKVNIQNEKARFSIIADFSDGRTLTGLTDLIHIIPSL